MSDLKIALFQTVQFWEDKMENLKHFEVQLKGLATDTDILIFPEMFHTGFTMSVKEMAEPMDGLGVQWLTKMAAKYDCAIVASLIIVEEGNYYNRMVFIEPSGAVNFYDKRKLFTLAKEDNYFSPGKQNTIVSYKGWKLLLQVCYDLRFPELARNKVQHENFDYDVLLYVANWPKKRASHWQALLRARAIENQCYVAAVNRVGKDANELDYSGNSSIIDALGNILAETIDKETITYHVLQKSELHQVREKLPFLKDQ